MSDSLEELQARKSRLILEAEVAALEAGKKAAETRAKCRQMTAQQLTEGVISGSMDLVTVWADLLDRWRDGMQFIAPLSTANDRRQGKDFPFFQTEQDLAIYRGTARILVGSGGYAKGLSRGLRSFVIGQGYACNVKPKRDGVRKQFVAVVQDVLDEYRNRVRWQNLKRETFTRSIRDGEYFELYGLGDDGLTWTRTVEPEQCTQPPGASWEEWSFGIRTPRDDCQDRQAYWFSYLDNPADGEEVDAGDVIHFKRNTDRSIKRGITDFCLETYDALNMAAKLRKAMSVGATIQASIAAVREHATADVNQATTFQQAAVDTTLVNPLSGRGQDTAYFEPGQFLDIPATYKYVPPPGATNAQAHVEILDASCRAAAAAWNAPEWLVHSNAQNMGAYTSSLVAESPFVIGIKMEQDDYAWAELQAMHIVIRHAIEAGRLPPQTLDYVEIVIEPPKIEARNLLEEANRDEVEIRAGFKSRQMAAQERGYDWEQVEQENQEYEETHPSAGSPFEMPGGKPPGGGGSIADPAGPDASLESIDPKAAAKLLESNFTGIVTNVKTGQKFRYVNGKRNFRQGKLFA